MSIKITDSALLDQLSVTDSAEITDESGRVIGDFTRRLYRLPAGVQSPFTNDELAELRTHQDGRPLADILRDLRARG